MYCHSLPADPTLTINNLCLVTSSVQDWKRLGNYDYGLGVPHPVLNKISDNPAILTEKDKMAAMLQYFLNNVPMASWQKVAGALYMMKEEKALQAVKKFLTASRGELASSQAPSQERARYPLHAHVLDFYGGCGYTHHSQTREQVVMKRPTISTTGGETNKTGSAALPPLVNLWSITNGITL